MRLLGTTSLRLAVFVAVLGIVSADRTPAAPDQASAAKAPSQSNRLLVMIVATATVGEPAADIERVRQVFQLGVASANAQSEAKPGDANFVEYDPTGDTFVTVIPDGFGRKQLFEQIENLVVDGSTTLVFYYRGHAVTDYDWGRFLRLEPATHLLQLDSSRDERVVPRKELLNKLKSRKARLTVLLTECCAKVVSGRSPGVLTAGIARDEGLFKDLFLMPEGVVDITSARFDVNPASGRVTDEYSWVPPQGGLFTRAFHFLMTRDNPKTQLVGDPKKLVTWREFSLALGKETDANYKAFRRWKFDNPDEQPALADAEAIALYRQTTQTPTVNELPKQPETSATDGHPGVGARPK
jgi:hypothetical protein